MCDVEKELAKATGTDSSEGWLAKTTGNVLAPGGTFAPGAGGLNFLNPDSIVGRMTKDVGQLNPFNSDTVMAKVYNNIGQDMQRDPLKWVAIAAAVATGQVQLIPYINAVATVTSKNSTPEEWLTEGAKAYIISSGGDWVAKNIGGVGPQTDITTGETFAGTGAAGATSSAQVGAVAGNISRNIFATAARKGSTDINSAQIVTGALTNEALNEAFKYIPGFSDLSKSDQALAVNAFKVAANKDGNAAYQLFNQGFDATIKGLNDAAKAIGYKDLNQQNAVNNFVQDQGSAEDVDALKQYEQKAQDAYNAYAPMKEKNDAWFAKNDEYSTALNKYIQTNKDPFVPYSAKLALYNDALARWNWLQDPQNYYTPDKVTAAEQAYNAAKADAEPFIKNVSTLQEQGWDNLAQQKEAAAAGFTTPEAYDTYLTDEAEKLRKAGLQEQSDKEAAEAAVKAEDERKAQEAAKQAAIDEQNRIDQEAAKQQAADEAERLRLAGLQEKDVDLNKVVAGTNTVIEGGGAGVIDTNQEPGYKPNVYNPIGDISKNVTAYPTGGYEGPDTEYVPPSISADQPDVNLTNISGGSTDKNNVVDTLTNSGLTDTSDTVDLNKVVSGADTAVASNEDDTVIAGSGADTVEGGTDTTDDAEQAKRVADFGKDLTGGGVQDLGDVDTETDFYDADSTGTGAYKYDPTSGTYTYTSDDGSTLTLDGDGNIVGFTEATDTPWTGLTDTTTGNLRLPKLPGGITPTVKPPAKKTTTVTTGTGNTTTATSTGTTTTGTGNTAITTGSSTVVSNTGNTAVTGPSSSDKILALLGYLDGGGAQQQTPYTPAQVPVADIKSYYNTIRGISGENLLAKSKDEKDKFNVDELFAEGGTVDDLLRFLRG